MKKLLFLLSFSILFQSCYSYKSIDYSTIEIDKKLQLEVLRLNKTSMKGRLVSKNEKTIILQTKNGQGTIPMEEVYNIKVKEFSVSKTLGATALIPVAAYTFIIYPSVVIGGGM